MKRLALVRFAFRGRSNLKTHPKIASWNPNDPAALIGEKDLVLDAGCTARKQICARLSFFSTYLACLFERKCYPTKCLLSKPTKLCPLVVRNPLHALSQRPATLFGRLDSQGYKHQFLLPFQGPNNPGSARFVSCRPGRTPKWREMCLGGSPLRNPN